MNRFSHAFPTLRDSGHFQWKHAGFKDRTAPGPLISLAEDARSAGMAKYTIRGFTAMCLVFAALGSALLF